MGKGRMDVQRGRIGRARGLGRIARALVVLLAIFAGSPGTQAQTPPPAIVVDAQTATAQFPDRIVFSLTAHHAGGGQITWAAVSYQVPGDPYTREIAAADFTPAAEETLTAT